MDTHTKKRQVSKDNTNDSHQVTREERQEEERNKKEPQKQPQNDQPNGNKYIPINKYFKCKWTKCFTQKIQSG